MKKIILTILVMFCLIPLAIRSSELSEMKNFFPVIDGWARDEVPKIYTPVNLFEYINGAAEVYLSYGFQELAVLNYDNEQEQSVTIEIYRHSNPNNGFGIYSQEKPLESTFLSIGIQGYYEHGVLNFFKGDYYVKLLSFGLGDKDRSVLVKIAEEVAEKLPGETDFPKAVLCFPEEGRVKNSERYIAKNFLGHSFLHSAFIADYEMEKEKHRVFIIEAMDTTDAEDMFQKYLKLLEKNEVSPIIEGGMYHFQDPYFSSKGMMNLNKSGRYIWGLFSDDRALSDFYLKTIEENLKTQHMIK